MNPDSRTPAADYPPLVEARGLGHRYTKDRWIFRGIDVEARPGRVLGVLGPNGRGKSTLLRLLAGVARPTEGTVTAHAPVAYVPQSHALPFTYPVTDMVLMGRSRHLKAYATPAVATANWPRRRCTGWASRTWPTVRTPNSPAASSR